MHRIALAILLAGICVLLQIFRIPYAADYLGQTPSGTGSLVHLQAGFLLMLAMLDRSRLFLRVCTLASAATWTVAMLLDHDASAWIGIPLFLCEYAVTVGCARLAGFPQHAAQPLGSTEVLRAMFVGLLIFPLAWTFVGLTLSSMVHPYGVEATINLTLQTLIAKHFGASIITLPMVLLFTEGHSWIKPSRQRDRMIPFLIVTVVLACVSVLWRGIRGEDGSTLAGGVLEYRLLLTAVLAWAIMRLPPRLSMPLLALTMLALVYSVAASINSLSSADGIFRLVLLAIELMVMQGLLLVLYVVARNARRMHEQLTREAMADTLTGLQNLKALRARTRLAPPPDRELGYLLLDNIEGVLGGLGLKAYAGLMAAVSARLTGVADTYYLTSGQFVLQRVDAGEGVAKWRKIVEQLERLEFVWEGCAYRVTPYLGIARLRADDDDSLDEAIAAASQAAMQACRQRETEPLSAAQLAHHKVSQQQTPQSALTRTSDVLSLIRNDKLVLHFQPMRRLDRDRNADVTAGEVLYRLRLRNGELRSPALFIGELESAGRLVELDRAVIRQLMTWVALHRRALGHLEHIGINLTGQSLTSASFMRELIGMMRLPPLPPQVFCFEVTESAMISDVASTRQRLDELRSLGCRIAIDDFGTGVQSFERLKQLPFDLLKIDGSFVRNASRHHRDYELVQASVTIAHAFGAIAVAEYVENKATLDCMRELGVQWGQGFVLGHPQPIQSLLNPKVSWPADAEITTA
ncbi:MAG: EAL domain-containing protein [Dokdonella sp.]